jgi:hypothetical protein
MSLTELKPKRVFIVDDPEKLMAEAGFGKASREVDMMNEMMVEGSGMEGMDMSKPGHPPTHSGHDEH